ncbi:MAG: aminoglycoside phosphotransferase family protein [Clostridiales bacterium]|nr:aminoglycoside phosphotransferase family protein [Clostridiales bacterium]
MDEKLKEVCTAFRLPGTYLGYESIQVGIVNRTYKVNFRLDDGKEKSFLVQNVNTYAFRNPIGLMNNIDLVTEHIRAKCPQKLSLHFHHTADRKTYLVDGSNFWRVMNYVPSATYSATKDPVILRNAGKAFGEFQNQLADFDIRLLVETIPGFHDTRRRYESLDEAIARDAVGRVEETQAEIGYLQSIRDLACTLTDLGREGRLPLRVTHNDTKINNVLFDEKTNEALVVIDLDTVMPGLMGHDFGDAIRFAANFVAEDCPDYDRVGIDLEVYRAFAQGFLEKTRDTMTSEERATLATSCISLTAELAVRFLDDYLRGDLYFTTQYPEHNLVRTRNQIALCRDMVAHLDEMNEIVFRCAEQ